MPEVARAFEREFGVEGAALGSPESAPLPGAPPLEQGEEPCREEDSGEEGSQTAPAAPRREIDQDGQAEQAEERARRHGRAEQEPRASEKHEVLPFQTAPDEQREEDAGHEEDILLQAEGVGEGRRGEEEAGHEEGSAGVLREQPQGRDRHGEEEGHVEQGDPPHA